MRRVELAWPLEAGAPNLGSFADSASPHPRVTATFTSESEPFGVQLLRSAKRLLQTR